MDRCNPLRVDVGYFVFLWHGGKYIDVLLKDRETGETTYTDRCINVWDYEKGKARIPFTYNALINEAVNAYQDWGCYLG